MAEYRLSALLSVKDQLSAGLRAAQREAEKLTRGVKGAKDQELRWRVGVEGMEKIKRLQSMAKGMKFSPIRLDVQDNGGMSKIKNLRSQISSLADKAHNVVVNVQTRGAEKLRGVKQNVSEMANGMMLATGAGVMGVAGVGYGIADTINTYKTFDYQMKRNKALFTTGMAPEEAQPIYQQLMDTARKYGSTMIYTNAEVGKALEYMALAGWDANTSMRGLPAVLNAAVASGEDLGLVSDIITDDMTAMGYKAGTYVKNGMGDMVEATQHFSDVLLRTTLRSNTNFQQLGYAMKYAAPLANALGYNIEDVAIAMGLMANNGIKADQAGTALRGMLVRMAKAPKQAAEAMEALGVSAFDATGKSKGLMANLMGIRAALKGKDAENILDFVEQMTGEQIGDRGEVADFIKEEMAANGGKLTDKSLSKLASQFSGTYALAGFLALMNSTDEDIKKLMTEIYQKSDGTGAEINKEMMDTLQGDLKTIQSAWEDFQFELLNGKGSEGLRNFLKAATADINAFKNSLKDGFDLSDIFGLIGNVVTQLKDKFLALDGIGSVLAGGVLMVGLKKLLNMGLRIRTALGEITKLGATAAMTGAKATSTLPAATAMSNVGTMNVKAGVVNLAGPVKGLNGVGGKGMTPAQTGYVQSYYAKKAAANEAALARSQAGSVAALNAATTAANQARSARIANMKSAAGGGAALAGVFGLMDVMSKRSMAQSRLADIDAQINEQKKILQDLRGNSDTNQEQISRQVAAIHELENSRNDIVAQNKVEEFAAGSAAIGSIAGTALGAAIGSLAGPMGTILGGIVGGAICEKIGEYFGEKKAQSDLEEAKKNSNQAPPELWGSKEAPSVSDFRKADEEISRNTPTPPRATMGDFHRVDEERLKADRAQAEATRKQIERFKDFDERLTKITGTPFFNRQAEQDTLNFYKNKSARLQQNNTPEVKPIESLLPDFQNFNFGEKLGAFFDDLFGVKRAEAAELSPEQLQQQAAMERGEVIQPTQPELPQTQPTDFPELGVEGLTENLFSQLEGLGEGVTEIFTGLGEQIQTGLTSALEGAGEIFSTFGTTIQEGLTSAFTGATEIFSTFGLTIQEGLTSAFTGATEIFSTFGLTIQEGLTSAFTGATEIFSTFGLTIQEGLTSAFTGATEIFSTFGLTIQEGLTSAFTGATEIFSTFGLTIQEGLTSAFTGVGEVFSGLSEQISAGLMTAQASADASLASIKASFDSGLQAIQGAWGALPGFFDGVFSGLGGAAAAAGSAIYSGLTSIIGAVIGAWQAAASTISGIISSISAMASSVGSMIPSFGVGSNYKGTASFEGGFTEINEHGGELVILPSGAKIYPAATTKELLRREIQNRLREQDGFRDLGLSGLEIDSPSRDAQSIGLSALNQSDEASGVVALMQNLLRSFNLPQINFDDQFSNLQPAQNDLPVPQINFPSTSDAGTSTSTTNNNTTTNPSFNFGGVTINNGADFEEFVHRLRTMVDGAAENSIQI